MIVTDTKSLLSSIVLVLGLFFVSCTSIKNIPYMSNSDSFQSADSVGLPEARIMPKDQLMIFVYSPDDIDAVKQFNFAVYGQFLKNDGRDLAFAFGGTRMTYIVDNEGNIDFPLVGKVNLLGMTKKEAINTISQKIRPFLQESTEAIVNIWFREYPVSVFGEVNKPGTFNITSERVTVLEALAMAGDMTIYGQRDNVKLIRTGLDGEKEVHELDFTDANILNSPYYYMQQQDILYVEPNDVKKQNAEVGQTTTLWFRGVSIFVSIGSLLYNILTD